MPQNYYIAKVSPGPPCTFFTYLDVSEKQVFCAIIAKIKPRRSFMPT